MNRCGRRPGREHYTESILMAGKGNVKYNCTKIKLEFGKNASPGQKGKNDVTLTSPAPHGKIAWWYADVVELVDSLDLGAVTLVKVFREVLLWNEMKMHLPGKQYLWLDISA